MESFKEAMQVVTVVEQDPERQEATALEGLKVQFISLVPNPANKRHFLVLKASSLGEGFEVVEKQIAIVRKDAVRKMVYGVVLAPNEVDDELDTISEAEIEKAAYAFMQGGRTQQIDTDHSTEAGAGFVAESWIVRAGDPLFSEETPGTWVVGVKVTDEASWGRIEKEELLGFSVGGVAKRVPVEIEIEQAGEVIGNAVAKQQANEGEAMFTDVVETGASIDRIEKSVEDASASIADRFISKVRKALGVDDSSSSEPVEKALRVEIQEKKSDMSASSAGGVEAVTDKGIRVEIQEKKSDMSAGDGATVEVQEAGTEKRVWIQEKKSDMAGKTGEAIQMAREAQDWSAVDLAEMMRGDGARSASTIGQIERGEIVDVPDDALDEFARVLPGATARALKDLRDGTNSTVEKSFKEKLLRSQVWNITSALSDAISEILRDDDVADKVAAVNTVVEEFQTWLASQMSQAVAKSSPVDVERAVQKAVAPLTEQIGALEAELETLGRQTALGGADREAVEKSGKGYRGLKIKL